MVLFVIISAAEDSLLATDWLMFSGKCCLKRTLLFFLSEDREESIMKALRHFAVITLAVALTSGCMNRADIDKHFENQEKIIAKLDEMKKAGPAKAPARPQRPAGPDRKKTYSVPVTADTAQTGKADAWVTIVEVSDFQCPFCKRVNPTLEQVKKEYGDDVRIAFMHNPLSFHNRAMPAAMGAECANDQGKFWPMHDRLFENPKALSDENITGYAKSIGVDMGKWTECYKSGKHKAKIQKQQSTAVSLGARGTPAFFINGRFLSGAQPFPSFKTLIDEELAKAKKSGIKKADYYKKAVIEKGSKKI